jgi:hypothetical protein
MTGEIKRLPNQPDAANPAMALWLTIDDHRPRFADLGRSPIMRAERAKPKSCKDDEMIAQGKRSAALGHGRKMIPSFFPSGVARLGRATSEGKKEVGWGASLPRAAASAALPWATFFLPLRGARKANHPAAGKAGIVPGLAIEHHSPALPEPGR